MQDANAATLYRTGLYKRGLCKFDSRNSHRHAYPRPWTMPPLFIPPIVFTGPAVCATFSCVTAYPRARRLGHCKRPATELVATPLVLRYRNTYRQTSVFPGSAERYRTAKG